MRLKVLGVIVTAIVWIAVAPAAAHHAFSAEFDDTKPVTLTGAVTSVRWSNPHAWIYIDVEGEDGQVVNWAAEFGGANSLYRRGWRQSDVAPGSLVTVEGFRARSGTPTANASRVTLPNGRRLFAGPAPGSAGAAR